MKIKIHKINNKPIAEINSEKVVITEVQDALDIMAECDYLGARKIIIKEENITQNFFELKTRLAGEILQKFTNYKVDLAIIGNFEKYKSKSLNDFIYESNKHGKIVFVPTLENAIERLSTI
ncbi:MAG: DUF4180 domain-containing protein [Ignavibacteriales bacterium]|nr:DUF4180 domain-containing protein [Ignavibacteriales bacterium]